MVAALQRNLSKYGPILLSGDETAESSNDVIVEGKQEINRRLRLMGGIVYSQIDDTTQVSTDYRLLSWLGTDPANPANYLWLAAEPPGWQLSIEASILRQLQSE